MHRTYYDNMVQIVVKLCSYDFRVFRLGMQICELLCVCERQIQNDKVSGEEFVFSKAYHVLGDSQLDRDLAEPECTTSDLRLSRVCKTTHEYVSQSCEEDAMEKLEVHEAGLDEGGA